MRKHLILAIWIGSLCLTMTFFLSMTVVVLEIVAPNTALPLIVKQVALTIFDIGLVAFWAALVGVASGSLIYGWRTRRQERIAAKDGEGIV